jgi:hypothetical protein
MFPGLPHKSAGPDLLRKPAPPGSWRWETSDKGRPAPHANVGVPSA